MFAHARSRSLVTTAFNAEDGRSLETLSSAARKLASEFPAWLRTEMRTNHAGEYGAVLIYGGALRAAALRQKMGLETDNGRMREFAERHRAHEQAHLDIMMTLVPESNRSRLLPVWSVAAQSLGFFPALVGPRCLYWTVASVETFVEQHYDAQIARLRREGALPDVAALLERLCAEEVRAIATPACPVPPSSAPPCEPRAALAGRAQGRRGRGALRAAGRAGRAHAGPDRARVGCTGRGGVRRGSHGVKAPVRRPGRAGSAARLSLRGLPRRAWRFAAARPRSKLIAALPAHRRGLVWGSGIMYIAVEHHLPMRILTSRPRPACPLPAAVNCMRTASRWVRGGRRRPDRGAQDSPRGSAPPCAPLPAPARLCPLPARTPLRCRAADAADTACPSLSSKPPFPAPPARRAPSPSKRARSWARRPASPLRSRRRPTSPLHETQRCAEPCSCVGVRRARSERQKVLERSPPAPGASAQRLRSSRSHRPAGLGGPGAGTDRTGS